MNDKIHQDNEIVLSTLSNYLNNNENIITTNSINKVKACGVNNQTAFKLLFLSYFNIDDENLIQNYYDYSFNELNKNEYINNPYYKNIKFISKRTNKWELKIDKYPPFSGFVCDDFKEINGRIIPQIGFFSTPFYYFSVYQNNRLWMSITPNEINTMKKDIEDAHGNVITFGLGLGYYAYMISLKDNVSSITIIEKDENVIELFKQNILPFFKYKEKIHIIKDDAFRYIENMNSNFDYLFIDLWHDVSDGLPMYLKFKPYEKKYPTTTFRYWIYNSIKYYL